MVQRFAVIYPFVSSHCHYLWYCGQTLPIAIICGIVYKLRLQNSWRWTKFLNSNILNMYFWNKIIIWVARCCSKKGGNLTEKGEGHSSVRSLENSVHCKLGLSQTLPITNSAHHRLGPWLFIYWNNANKLGLLLAILIIYNLNVDVYFSFLFFRIFSYIIDIIMSVFNMNFNEEIDK